MKTTSRIVLFFLSAALAVTLLFIDPVKPEAAEELKPPLLPYISDVQLYDQTDYNWTIRRLNGEDVGLSKFKNRVVFLHFWATWCPHCKAQMSSIQRLYESLRDKDDIEFIIASYQDQETVQKYISIKKIRLPIYLHKSAVPPVFGPRKRIPRTFVIDRTGHIVYQHIGAAKWDDESVLKFLESLL
jgi:thiol-disulfide isomerase/thioredoxin